MSAFEIRGVVEGFYGTPWTMEDRATLLKEMGGMNMNMYVYAAKDDLLHRQEWQKPYPASFMDAFQKLVQTGLQNNVEVSIAISPGLTVTYSDSKMIDALVSKYIGFANMGVRNFCLFLDDIPNRVVKEEDQRQFSNFPEAQVFFTNQVFLRLKSLTDVATFFYCPTQYCGNPDTDYLKLLGKELHPDIDILWTGAQVCSRAISLEDGERISNVLKRKVVFWDNYPVNDASMLPELHIAPYTGRDSRLSSVSKGFLINPMNQPYASLPILFSISRYLNNPERYQPDEAWKEGIAKYAKEAWKSLLLFSGVNRISALNPEGEGNEAENWISTFQSLFREGNYEHAFIYLANQAENVLNAVKELKAKMPAEWVKEVNPWLTEFEKWGEILKITTELMRQNFIFYHEELQSEEVEKVKEMVKGLTLKMKDMVEQNTVCMGNTIRNFAMKALVTSKGLMRLRGCQG